MPTLPAASKQVLRMLIVGCVQVNIRFDFAQEPSKRVTVPSSNTVPFDFMAQMRKPRFATDISVVPRAPSLTLARHPCGNRLLLDLTSLAVSEAMSYFIFLV